MESDTENEVSNGNRKFGYSEILWEIENYLSATCSKNWIIDSPEFSVRGSQITKWRLALKPLYLNEKYTVSVYIERLESDDFSDPVRLRWKFLYSFEGNEHFVSEKASIFAIKSTYGLEITNIEAIEEKMRKTTFDKLCIRYLMIVYDINGAQFNPPTDSGLKSLSQDMTVLYRLNKKSDVILSIGDKIRAHKSILCARNRVLNSKINKDSEEIKIDHPWIEKECAKGLIAFLYTGNLEYVFRTPSFSMQAYIDYFKVNELKVYFTKDELKIRTSFDVQEIESSWSIPKIYLNIDDISSDAWKLGIVDASFRLRLSLDMEEKRKKEAVEEKPETRVSAIKFPASVSSTNGIGKKPRETDEDQLKNARAEKDKNNETAKRKPVQDREPNEILKEKHQNEQSQEEKNKESIEDVSPEEKQNDISSPEKSKKGSAHGIKETNSKVDEETHYVGIYVDFVKGVPPKEVYLTCAIYDMNQEFKVMNGSTWNSDENEEFGIKNFFPRNMLTDPSFLNKDKLSIAFKLKIPSGVKRHTVISSKTCCTGPNNDYHYEKLSRNLGFLLQSGIYSDLTVGSRVLRFPVHSIILSTRSYVFANIIRDLNREDSLAIRDVDARTFGIVLRYIYTGKLNDFKSEDLKKIYTAAVKFGLLSLRKTCSRLLQDDINLQNVLDVLVLAHEKLDLKLKSSAFKFICNHLDEIQIQENWDSFLDANPKVSRELVEFKKKYIDRKGK